MSPDNTLHGPQTPQHTTGDLSPRTELITSAPLELVDLTYNESSPTYLLETSLAEQLRLRLPARLRVAEHWRLVYSLDRDGASLATLYQKCGQFRDKMWGYVLVVKDVEGCRFGAYLSEYPHPAPSFFGNGECFLWRVTRATMATSTAGKENNESRVDRGTIGSQSMPSVHVSAIADGPAATVPNLECFPYSGINEYFINCDTRFLSLGAGDSQYGLWLDDALDQGHSSSCQTFVNKPLSSIGEKFGILGVEIWGVGIS